MDTSSQFSDPLPFGSDSLSMDKQEETSSSSDASTECRTGLSNQNMPILATSRPKKRAGRRIFKETRHPVYRGVRKRNGNKWVCELREPNKKTRLWLGTYPTPEMAARAHDVAALALRGKSACLNFADSLWRLPVPISNDSSDIRRAANEAAELFRPQEFGGNYKVTENVAVVEDSSEVSSGDYKVSQDTMTFLDEEALFDMPGLIMDLAEGLLLPPPYYLGECSYWDDTETSSDLSLWN
ncbi:hypothetical protein K2173_018202 [Erythroxylum novogranatense]|uniref:AP2/ERF domain-containing protein n=1 Tax=Erythroxylum novogranatense TaxID=1862640 RepID=A0AAV8TNJ4_9ROSI|nr:hypothetical protein K2173_018202 [Erythroxylum novogranatense]